MANASIMGDWWSENSESVFCKSYWQDIIVGSPSPKFPNSYQKDQINT